jgi:hypothetical protein
MFGGLGLPSASDLDDTWEWDGETWMQVSDIGPPARGGHAMAYDKQRERVVLFGGRVVAGGLDAYFSDTWEWNGQYWTVVCETGPSARYGHAMAYDSASGRVVLQGGGDSGNPNAWSETWEWDGEAWTEAARTIGPGFRFLHAMAYDEGRKRMVLFGGAGPEASAPPTDGDTWERADGIWARLATIGPAPRQLHAMAYRGDGVILFGGTTGAGNDSATWQWDGKHWAQRGDFGPSPRALSTMAYDSARDRVVLFGGQVDSTVLGDTWELAEHTSAIPMSG